MIASRDTQRTGPRVLGIQSRGGGTSTLTLWLGFLLAAITVLCYWPITTHKFICLDDQHYLFDSPHVKSGLSWQGFIWAFRTGYFSDWHPLTWISFMLDSQLYGLNPRGFLLTNLVLHTA